MELAKATPTVRLRHKHLYGPDSKRMLGYPPTMPQIHSTGQNSQLPSKPLNFANLGFKQKLWTHPYLPSYTDPSPSKVNLLPTKLGYRFYTHLLAAQLHPPDCSLCLATDSLHTTQMLANYASGWGLPAVLGLNSLKLHVATICQHATAKQASRLPTCPQTLLSIPSSFFSQRSTLDNIHARINL